MTNSEIVKKLKKLKYIIGVRKTHFTIWNCPCKSDSHPVHVENHQGECRNYYHGVLRRLGPHKKDFLS